MMLEYQIMDNYLVGSGHFAIGFLIGFVIMLLLQVSYSRNIYVQMYTPFIPFLAGLWSSIPYFFISEHEISIPWLNVFFLFNYFHYNELVIKIFGRISTVALVCGSMYIYIILRYIALVKYSRRYGWKKGRNNAR
jgi:hypothetical protein